MDRMAAMKIFVRVVRAGSFTAVALELNSTQPTISKKISQLETELGVKLLRRTSREQELTEAGQEYFERCQKILDDIDETESLVRSLRVSPQGVLRITAPVDFSNSILAPLLQTFLECYPDIKIDLILDNREIDLIAEGVDVAVRVGDLKDSSLFAKHISKSYYCMVASPTYIKRNGIPKIAKDMAQHNCVQYSLHDNVDFIKDEEGQSVSVSGNFRCNSGNMILESAIIGTGMAILPYWLVYQALKSGELVQVFSKAEPIYFPISTVFIDKKYLPLKVQSFIDFFKVEINKHPAFI
jgi:DNA-binding transcriptional LysR family regulator